MILAGWTLLMSLRFQGRPAPCLGAGIALVVWRLLRDVAMADAGPRFGHGYKDEIVVISRTFAPRHDALRASRALAITLRLVEPPVSGRRGNHSPGVSLTPSLRARQVWHTVTCLTFIATALKR